MRRCGYPSQPMWKTTSRAPGSRSAASYSDAVERSKGLEPPPPADLLITEDEVARELANAVVVEELAIGGSGIGIWDRRYDSPSADRDVPRPHSRLDQRRQIRAGEWRSRRIRCRLPWPRRAHRRTAEGLRGSCRDGVRCGRRGPRRRDGRRRLVVARFSSALFAGACSGGSICTKEPVSTATWPWPHRLLPKGTPIEELGCDDVPKGLRTAAAAALLALGATLLAPPPTAAAAPPDAQDYCQGQCGDILPPGATGSATLVEILDKQQDQPSQGTTQHRQRRRPSTCRDRG